VEVRSSTHVSYLLTVASVNAGRFSGSGDITRTGQFDRAIRWKVGSLGGLLSVCILCFTVVSVLAIGILSAYGSVIGILHTFASQSRKGTAEKPVLASGQARAAHAGGR